MCSAGFIVYSRALGGAFQLDDYRVIVDNPAIKDISNLQRIWEFWPTRFITNLSFAANFRLERFNVFYYHLFNMIIHLGAAILVWRLTFLTFLAPAIKGEKIAGQKEMLSFFAGLVFVLHPVQTEAVSYIVQRATSLAAFFCLASLYLYIKSRLAESGTGPSGRQRYYYAASLVLAVAAAFTKEMAVILPLIILLYEFIFLKCDKPLRWQRLVPFIIVIFIVPVTMFATRSVDFKEMRLISEGPSGISPVRYLLTQTRVAITYMRLLFAPLNQNVDYDYHVAKTIMEWPVLAGIVIIIFILIVAIKILPKYRLLSFGVFFFFLTLLPESSVIPIADVIFEHRLYLPMAGYAIFLSAAVYYIFGRSSRKTMGAAMLVMVVIYSPLTYCRNAVWESKLALWDDAVRKSPDKSRPYNNRGFAYMEKGDFDAAMRDFKKAIALESSSDAGYYYNLGNVYNVKGRLSEAIFNYNEAIRINPGYAEAYIQRAVAYFKNGDYAASLEDVCKLESMGCYVPAGFREKLNDAMKESK
ncbi:MAG: tetratricopeptide repeat protein [Candidatus Omnitrophota bacterium]